MPRTKNHIKLKNFSGLKTGEGIARRVYEIQNLKDFVCLLQKIDKMDPQKILVVGGGSNLVFLNKNKDLIVLKIKIKEIRIEGGKFIKVGAGVNWDKFVQKYIKLGGVGMENLSAIPGTVGAAPMQNIGAYGAEVSEFIKSVEVYDRKERKIKILKNKDCHFQYRDSIFKQEKNRYIILYVTFILKKSKVQIPKQTEIQSRLVKIKKLKQGKLTVQDIRRVVIAIRKRKLPDPKQIPNCGSFFKNPIINQKQLKKLQAKFPDIPVYPPNGMREEVRVKSKLVKIPAAYIIEKLGLKGFNHNFTKGNFGIHQNHALIIISNGKGTGAELKKFIKFITQKVFKVSGITLEPEVVLE